TARVPNTGANLHGAPFWNDYRSGLRCPGTAARRGAGPAGDRLDPPAPAVSPELQAGAVGTDRPERPPSRGWHCEPRAAGGVAIAYLSPRLTRLDRRPAFSS